jgi:hypothetical protein
MASSFRFNDDGIKRLGRLFGQGGTIVRVGILTGPKKARQKKTGGPNDDATNADIGSEQEFGSFTKKIPPRSFLYKPLSAAKAKKRIVADAAEGLTRELASGSAVDAAQSFYGKIGAGLVASVQDAFDASGPGWKPLARETILRRRTRKVWPRTGTKPLIDTGELRNSISFKIMGSE